MTDRKKFEEMLERLVNEDREGAEELFHEIVVEKSREIYENLLDSEVDEATDEEVEETTDEEVDEATDEEVDEATDEEVDESEEEVDENFFDEMDDEDPVGDMAMDIEMPDEGGDDMDMGGDEEGDEDLEDRVMDLEDELESLKAEFEAMMGDDEESADDDMDMDGEEEPEMDMDADADNGDDEMPMESSDEDLDEQEEDEVEESKKSQAEIMREYTDKVTAKMGDNGANTKSTVASPNNMGGTAANIARNDTANDGEAGAGSKVKGSALNDQNPKEESAGNVNVPGGKAASLSAQPKGHGAEKKGTGDTAANKKSTLGS